MVNPSFPAATLPELITYAKANPEKVNLASAGTGSPPHVAGELFKTMAGINMVHVPYRGDAPAMIDVLGGHVQVYFSSLSGSIDHIRSGKLRALAVTGATRSEAMPEIPSVGEFIPGYEASGFWGIAAPRGTPKEVIETLNKETNASLADPNLQARFSELGAAIFPLSPAEFRRFIEAEADKWGRVVKLLGAKAG